MSSEPLFGEELLERARAVTLVLGEPERGDAERLLELCAALDRAALDGAAAKGAAPSDGSGGEGAGELGRELGRLVELLARRSARAMPLAALGRAALASLRGAVADARLLLREADEKLRLFGY